MTLKRKLSCLKRKISGYKSCVVAFSGGQDSGFLLKVCSLVLPKTNILAVLAVSATYPKDELRKAKILAKDIGVSLRVIKTAELNDKKFTVNSTFRCYFCKKELFSKLNIIAKQHQDAQVIDASTLSDKKDFRPGNRAKEEHLVRSPLQEAGFTKDDVRFYSKKAGLSSWDKPSLACLASRIPYGRKISVLLLKRIHTAEKIIQRMGFRQVRVRDYGIFCRIEVPQQEIAKIVNVRGRLADKLKNLGYTFITLDLEGYRTGSMNEVIMRR